MYVLNGSPTVWEFALFGNFDEVFRDRLPQQCAPRLGVNLLEAQWLLLNGRNAARHFLEQALSETGLLGFVPSLGVANVGLRLGPDDQSHTRPA